ncbi:MAG: hypothetical protein ACPGR8_17425, partial [Limisphaerales bacterium]
MGDFLAQRALEGAGAPEWHALYQQIDRLMAAASVVSTYLVAAANEAKERHEDGRYAVYMDNANRLIQSNLAPFTRWYQAIPSGGCLEMARERFCLVLQTYTFDSCFELLTTVGLECKLLDQPMGLLHMLQRQVFGAEGADR